MKGLLEPMKQKFAKDNFTVKKSNRAFSAMEIDQAHE